MKLKNSKIYLLAGLVSCSMAATLTSCNDYLDTLPDNRATVNSEEKVQKLLVSAYPVNDYILVNEYMSDNLDDTGASNPYTNRFLDQVFHWEDVTESDNESPERIWTACYEAIVNANQALAAIDEIGTESRNMQAAKAEGLLARAYAHFILVNEFCLHYNTKTSDTDPGIPYLDKLESTLNLHHERGTVAEVYEKIDKDLQEALPYVGSDYYSVPKFHFNPKAAYAFAARFYLYYEKYDKVIEYANLCLGDNPANQLRDWSNYLTMTASDEAYTNHYIDPSVNANLLLLTAYSNLGIAFGAYYSFKRYSHNYYLASNETVRARNIWGAYSTTTFYNPPRYYSATNLNTVIVWKLPYLFEFTDPVAQIGYRRTIYPALTTDEVILNRAEAYIMKKQFDQATEDLNTWMHNITRVRTNLTTKSIVNFYNGVDYSYDDATHMASTVKKHLHPSFEIDAEGSEQEAMLQAVIGFRRIETLHMGLRWWDIKRWGIVVPRRTMNAAGNPVEATDWLKVDDPRRAMQIPDKVIAAGIDPNPRIEKDNNNEIANEIIDDIYLVKE